MRCCVSAANAPTRRSTPRPEWLLRLERQGLRGLDAEEFVYIPNGALRTGVVCRVCNNG